jgi:hypothetical protein
MITFFLIGLTVLLVLSLTWNISFGSRKHQEPLKIKTPAEAPAEAPAEKASPEKWTLDEIMAREG